MIATLALGLVDVFSQSPFLLVAVALLVASVVFSLLSGLLDVAIYLAGVGALIAFILAGLSFIGVNVSAFLPMVF